VDTNTDLRTESADLLTAASLSPIIEAIFGSALVGSQAAIPNLRRRLSNSSRVPCRVFATFECSPFSKRSWNRRLYA